MGSGAREKGRCGPRPALTLEHRPIPPHSLEDGLAYSGAVHVGPGAQRRQPADLVALAGGRWRGAVQAASPAWQPPQHNPRSTGLASELDDLPPLSPLQPISEEEAVQIVADPLLPPASFTLRDYVDHSENLQKLVLLGVDLSKIEKHPDAANLLLRLDFEKDIKQILLFLKDLGIEDNQLGTYLTKNHAIFSEDLENLKTRVAYLLSKNFSKADIAQMVRNAPFLLSFSVERLDNRLGFFQKELELSVKKTRDLIVRLPRLLTGSLEPVKENIKVYRLELGFKHNEIQDMITKIPKMLTANKKKLTETFDYVHNVMNIPHHIIVRFPQVFNTRLFKVKERHLFLTYLGRAQYDPAKPNYISLDRLVSIPDEIFCEEIAKASVQDFEKFLKTV
ncbi:transcription termination factor 3, mitochondrial isoform X3 [Manis pentadactyla]|uniref:transcription termination factor 3, mitochondrial isoform X3 n=1 Tax=Manis pentadactyla TaxID=143292 RepID=UPI00255CF1AA|nr:transcription termination factor 3, mitochondrial isoform X3 [Manis pentadactyla]